MPNIFTDLPDAILRYRLMPFLDYNDRVALNACLPAEYRIRMRIKADAIVVADLINAVKNLKMPLKLIGKLKLGTVVLANAIYRYLTVHMPANLVLTQYDTSFRTALFERLDYFSSAEAYKGVNFSADFETKMLAACESLRTLLEKRYPFIRAVKLPVVNSYSFVNCGLPQIVEGFGCRTKRRQKSKGVS